MDINTQKKAPLYEALQKFRKQRVVPFDVPGHKRGRGNHELVELLGEKCVGLDVNSMKPLDNLCHPVSVILEAEQLAAEPDEEYEVFDDDTPLAPAELLCRLGSTRHGLGLPGSD